MKAIRTIESFDPAIIEAAARMSRDAPSVDTIMQAALYARTRHIAWNVAAYAGGIEWADD